MLGHFERQREVESTAQLEMTVELRTPVALTARTAAKDLVPDAELKRIAAALPARVGTGDAAEPLLLLLAGSRDEVQLALADAGYVASETLWAKAGPAAFLALAAKQGYQPAELPALDGQPAALSLEKQNNTLARRHRVMFWPRAETVRGQATWLGTAVRCVDLVFDKASGTFRHRLDPDADG